MLSGVRVRLPPWAPIRSKVHTLVLTASQTVHLISPDDVSVETVAVPCTERLCLVVIRIKDYTRELSDAERSYAHSVSRVRREQYSSGRRAVQLGLSSLNVSDVPILFDDRKPIWPTAIVGSIAHSQNLAVALVGFEQDFRGVGVDILPKQAVADKVRDRILHESELQFVHEEGHKDLQTMLFCAKESIYKACNPEIDEFLGFKDVVVKIEKSGAEFTANTVSKKRSTDLVSHGQGHVFSAENHWFTIFLIQ